MNVFKDVYVFWLDGVGEVPSSSNNKRWFMSGEKMDIDIRRNFELMGVLFSPDYDNIMEYYNLVNKPINELLKNWDEFKIAFMGRVIFTDQFFRHIFRNEAHAYVWELINRNVIIEFLKKISFSGKELFKLFSLAEILFLLLPLVHYEPGRGNKMRIGLNKCFYFEIEKVLNIWKEIDEKLPELVDENKINDYRQFIGKAIHNVKRHYEELKMNNGVYPKRNDIYVLKKPNIDNPSLETYNREPSLDN